MKRHGLSLAFVLLAACGEAAAPVPWPPSPPAVPVPTPPPVPAPPTVDNTPPPEPDVLHGEIRMLAARRRGDATPSVLVETDAVVAPTSPVVAYSEAHYSHWAYRELEVVTPPPWQSVVLVATYPDVDVCEATVTRARRLHATSLLEPGEVPDGPIVERTYIALEFEGCRRGQMAIVGAPRAAVSVHRLNTGALPDAVSLGIADLVREADRAEGLQVVQPAEMRAMTLPQHGVSVVCGWGCWVVRDGRVLYERWDGLATTLILAGRRAFFDVHSVTDDWTAPLECFGPSYDPGSCEVIDDSGTPANVRDGPSGRAAVVTTVALGTTVAADDHVGSWYHLATSPPGWAHESGLRCTVWPEHPRGCL